MWIVLNKNQCAPRQLPSSGSCYLFFHCKGTVDLYGDTESKGENSQGEIALKERFKLSGPERREGKERKEEGSDCWSLRQYFLGASVFSKSVKAGWAGFPSCRLNPRLGAVVLDISQHPDRLVLSNREKPFHVQLLTISTRFYNPQGLAAETRKGSFFFYPLFGTEHQAPLRIHQTSGFWQNGKLALKCSVSQQPGPSRPLCGVLMPMSYFQTHFQNQKTK